MHSLVERLRLLLAHRRIKSTATVGHERSKSVGRLCLCHATMMERCVDLIGSLTATRIIAAACTADMCESHCVVSRQARCCNAFRHP